jgi:very-short-patch-repair endonuclease
MRKRDRDLRKLGWKVLRISAKGKYSRKEIQKCIKFLRSPQ